MHLCQQLKICYKQLKLNNVKNSNNFHNKQQSKTKYSIEIFSFQWKFFSAPIVPIGPTTTDVHFDSSSSSMVNFKMSIKIFSLYILSYIDGSIYGWSWI
jgi:hypothetical protein